MAEQRATPATSVREILAGHKKLHHLLDSVHDALEDRDTDREQWCQRLGERLAAMAELLEPHFGYEERSGLFEQIREAAPEAAATCDELLAQHPAMLERLSHLRREAAVSGPDHPKALAARVRALIEMLLTHEARENELLVKAVEGSGGAPD